MAQHNVKDWHLFADRFAFYSDQKALSFIPKEVSNEEVQQYLYTFHNETLSIDDINNWRLERIRDQQ